MKPYPQSRRRADLSASSQPQRVRTSGRRSASSLIFLAFFLVLAPIALASSTWYVDGVNGSNNNSCKTHQTACKTIGHAISLASSGDSIRVAAATYAENLTIGFSLKIVGSGAGTTIIDGGGVDTVITIRNAKVYVTLSKVTIRNGLGVSGYGGGVNNNGTLTINDGVITGNTAYDGGGINNNGKLTINNGVVAGNTAQGSGGGVINIGGMTINKSTINGNSIVGDGGGIWNLGTLKINDSTISGNTAGKVLFSTGGGIANSATMSVNNSTISGNTVVRFGVGGIENLEGTLTISNSTISANRGGINVNLGTATLQNSIVANNSGQNCFNIVTSIGYNLSSDGSCNFNSPGDLNITNPMLGPLQPNGGPTKTHALLAGSPAIDGGNPAGCTDGQGRLLKTDQRGMPRPDKEDTGGCDMGAYERQKD
jgi:hypothetical protein